MKHEFSLYNLYISFLFKYIISLLLIIFLIEHCNSNNSLTDNQLILMTIKLFCLNYIARSTHVGRPINTNAFII